MDPGPTTNGNRHVLTLTRHEKEHCEHNRSTNQIINNVGGTHVHTTLNFPILPWSDAVAGLAADSSSDKLNNRQQTHQLVQDAAACSLPHAHPRTASECASGASARALDDIVGC